ncbi:MAG TPA: TetR/AcrR family transcriptional regulator [Mycobacterium sp.]|nr:TetR/AcrR family transcriptional regulator [Mycobacterium sp.]
MSGHSERRRAKIFDAAFDLFASHGYDHTTVDQIAAAAGISHGDFAQIFASKDALIIAVVEDLLQATASALARVPPETSPEEALLISTAEMLDAVIDDRGVMSRHRMLDMAHIVTTHPRLQRQASALRKQLLSHALADRLGVTPNDRRVRHAVSLWSAIAAGSYAGRLGMPSNYDPRSDDRLRKRMLSRLARTYARVTGENPTKNWPSPGPAD